MRMHFFSKGDITVPSSRFRVFLLADQLRALGHQVSVEEVPQTSRWSGLNPREWFQVVEYVKKLLAIDRRELLYLQRTIYNRFFFLAVLFARACGARYVFDIDDAVYLHSPFKTKALVRFASAVTCGGEEIAQWARRHNRRVYICSNALPDEYFSAIAVRSDPVIGWIGNGPAHYENLLLLRDALTRLVQGGFQFTFKLVGAVGDSRIYDFLKGIPGLRYQVVDSVDWSRPEQSVRELDGFTIGLMPLVDTPWNRSKYMKILEYMARGVVPVVSRIGEAARVFESGTEGYTVADDGWYDALSLLLKDPSARERLALNAAATARRKFTMRVRATEFMRMIEEKTSYEQ